MCLGCSDSKRSIKRSVWTEERLFVSGWPALQRASFSEKTKCAGVGRTRPIRGFHLTGRSLGDGLAWSGTAVLWTRVGGCLGEGRESGAADWWARVLLLRVKGTMGLKVRAERCALLWASRSEAVGGVSWLPHGPATQQGPQSTLLPKAGYSSPTVVTRHQSRSDWEKPAPIPPLTPLSWRCQHRCPSGPWAEAACHTALSPLCPGHRHRVTCSSYSERVAPPSGAAGMVRDPLRLQPPALLGSPFWGRGERPKEPAYRAYDSRPQEEGRSVFGGDRSCPYQASSRVTEREPTQCPGTELPLSWTALLVVGSVGSSCGPSVLSFLPVNISIHFLPLLVRWSWDFQFLTMSETFLGKHLMAVAGAWMASSGHPRTPPARSAQPSSLCQEQRESEIIAAKRKTPARLFFAASG